MNPINDNAPLPATASLQELYSALLNIPSTQTASSTSQASPSISNDAAFRSMYRGVNPDQFIGNATNVFSAIQDGIYSEEAKNSSNSIHQLFPANSYFDSQQANVMLKPSPQSQHQQSESQQTNPKTSLQPHATSASSPSSSSGHYNTNNLSQYLRQQLEVHSQPFRFATSSPQQATTTMYQSTPIPLTFPLSNNTLHANETASLFPSSLGVVLQQPQVIPMLSQFQMSQIHAVTPITSALSVPNAFSIPNSTSQASPQKPSAPPPSQKADPPKTSKAKKKGKKTKEKQTSKKETTQTKPASSPLIPSPSASTPSPSPVPAPSSSSATSSSTTSAITATFSERNEPTPYLLIRPARSKNYERFDSLRELNSVPYKYCLKIVLPFVIQNADGSITKIRKRTSLNYQLDHEDVVLTMVCQDPVKEKGYRVENGVSIEKHISTRIYDDRKEIEFRVSFHVFSYHHNNQEFILEVVDKEENGVVLRSNPVFLRARRKQSSKRKEGGSDGDEEEDEEQQSNTAAREYQFKDYSNTMNTNTSSSNTNTNNSSEQPPSKRQRT